MEGRCARHSCDMHSLHIRGLVQEERLPSTRQDTWTIRLLMVIACAEDLHRSQYPMMWFMWPDSPAIHRGQHWAAGLLSWALMSGATLVPLFPFGGTTCGWISHVSMGQSPTTAPYSMWPQPTNPLQSRFGCNSQFPCSSSRRRLL